MKKIVFITTIILCFSISSFAQENKKQIDITKKIIAHFNANHPDSIIAYFDKPMKEALPSKKLTEAWESVTKQCGKFVKSGKNDVEKSDKYIIVYNHCEFEKVKLFLKLIFNKDDKVSGLFFTTRKDE